MKKIMISALALVLLLSLAACGENSNPDNSSDNSTTTEDATPSNTQASASDEETSTEDSNDADLDSTNQDETKENVKSDGYEKFSQLEIGMTESEVNAILGEPTSVDKAYYYYNITVNGEDFELTVWINTVTGLVTNIYGDFSASDYRAEFADSATDLSKASGLESGEINTYDDCVSAFKTSGYLTSIDEDGVKRYLWVDASEGYMNVTFKADGSVKTYNGYC